jgi:hypothetical protein
MDYQTLKSAGKESGVLPLRINLLHILLYQCNNAVHIVKRIWCGLVGRNPDLEFIFEEHKE